MKTPDEIKNGLEQCAFGECACCPYTVMVDMPFGDEMGCADNLLPDALIYILQLERERDALLAALRRVDIDCDCCKHRIDSAEFCEESDFYCGDCRNKDNCRCEGCGRDNCNWEWCGIKEGAK